MKHRDLLKLALLPLAAGGVVETAAHAADATTAANTSEEASPPGAQQLEDVIVTGTRSKGRTVANSLSPIDVDRKSTV